MLNLQMKQESQREVRWHAQGQTVICNQQRWDSSTASQLPKFVLVIVILHFIAFFPRTQLFFIFYPIYYTKQFSPVDFQPPDSIQLSSSLDLLSHCQLELLFLYLESIFPGSHAIIFDLRIKSILLQDKKKNILIVILLKTQVINRIPQNRFKTYSNQS